MGYLLTAGVLGFQVAIFLTIVGAGTVGRDKLWLFTIGWTLFTLLGSIFTVGLLLLQLVTIAISFAIGSAMGPTVQQRVEAPIAVSQQLPPPVAKPHPGWDTFRLLIVACALVWLAYVISRPPSPLPPASGVVQSVAIPPSVAKLQPPREATTRAHKQRSRVSSSPDLRHCLSLGSNAAIAKCAEQAR